MAGSNGVITAYTSPGRGATPRFDFGNSSTEIFEAEVPASSTVVLSPTNGTCVVEAARGAPAFLTGVLGTWVAMIGCDWEGRRPSEDESAAGAILHRFGTKGAGLDGRAQRVVSLYLERPEKALRQNSATRRLKRLGYEEDLDFCLARNTVPVVPVGVWPGGQKEERGRGQNIRQKSS